jgi:tetratricopeptide (TPR) repeat protein
MNPDNPVVQLCARGMQAETEGRDEDASALFREAWDTATDDYDACVAAHYLARHQKSPEDALRWNQECLDRADRVGDERVRGFYPSLHLNLARAHQELGDRKTAYAHYRDAVEHMGEVPPGPYGDGIRYAVAEGLKDTGYTAPERPKSLSDLLGKLCARTDLRSLGMLLPAYLGDLGTQDDRLRLLTALQMVHTGRTLPDDEQSLARQAIGELST